VLSLLEDNAPRKEVFMTVRFASIVMAAVFAIVIGVAVPAEAQELISACVKTGQGQIRIVQATDPCLTGEQRLQWPASAPAKGALRVLDATDKFVGWYSHGGWGDAGTTTIAVGTEWLAVPLMVNGPEKTGGPPLYFNTPCPNSADPTVLHATGAHIVAQSQRLVKFAFGLPNAPNIVYYAGTEDPTFLPLSWETTAGTTRACYDTFGNPYFATLKYAPALTFDFSMFTAPYRIVP
jgi:hypothetical protein